MKRTISIGAVLVGACLIWLWLANGAATKPADRDAVGEARVEVMYPPAFDQIAPATAAIGPLGLLDADLCGYGRVKKQQIPESLQAEADAAILRVVGDFERGSDDRKHALGLAMRALLKAEAAERRLAAEDPQNCRENAENALCDQGLSAAYARAATPAIEELVRLAASTRNPQVYVTAMRACRSIVESPPTCSALTDDQWAQLDPDNASPWLMKARAARLRKETEEFEEALLRASHARVFDRRTTGYADLLVSADGRDPAVRTLIISKLIAAVGRADPGEHFSLTMFSLFCSRADKPEQREVCNDLTRVLGAGSAERVPSPFVQFLLRNRFLGGASDLGILSCEGSQKAEEWLRDQVQPQTTTSRPSQPPDAPARQRTPPVSR